MFDWFWSFLYGISKSIFRIIDGLMSCANMLCGIEPIKYQGVEMDFVTFLLQNKNVSLGFVGAAIVGVILTFIFGVIAIIRAVTSEKSNVTPAQATVKIGKTLLTFIFIPICLAILVYFTNIIMQALYMSTSGGSTDGIGRFLAGAFGQDARKSGIPEDFYLDPSFDYTSTSSARKFMDLTDYDYFFSWIGGVCILISLASILLMFVDRAISIVILFIVSPISLSTAVFDEGQHFKLWRDQFFVKFLTGYGCIIALNVYALIIGAITSDGLVFFKNSFLNNLMKLAFIIGGAVSMQRMMALIGNIIAQGAGSNELRDNAIATSQMKGILAPIAKAPFSATTGAVNFVRDAREHGIGAAIGSRLGFNTSKDYGKMSRTQSRQNDQLMQKKEDMRRATNASLGGSIANKVVSAISGDKKQEGGGGGGNAVANAIGGGAAKQEKKENSMVDNAINNSLNAKKEKDEK